MSTGGYQLSRSCDGAIGGNGIVGAGRGERP